MAAQLLDGRTLAKTLREELTPKFAAVAAARKRPATLAVVQVAGDPAADRYVRSILKACSDVGAHGQTHQLSADVDQAALEHVIVTLSADAAVDGIIVQLPLPAHLNQASAIAQLDPRKDVDGVHPTNLGLLAQGQPGFVPNTPAGGMELLRQSGAPISGQRAVVVGRSVSVGKPMALLLMNANATVTVAHSRTADLARVVSEAEILVAAVGRPGLITGEMIRPGAVVIDFGINVQPDGSIVGDVDAQRAADVASAITPVPGGTGPVTNVMLLGNLLRAAG